MRASSKIHQDAANLKSIEADIYAHAEFSRHVKSAHPRMSDNGQLKQKSQLREIWRTQPKKPNHRHPGRGKPAPSAPVGALAHLRAGRVRNGAAKHNQSTTRSRSMKPSSIIQVQHVASSQRRQVEVEGLCFRLFSKRLPALSCLPSAAGVGLLSPRAYPAPVKNGHNSIRQASK